MSDEQRKDEETEVEAHRFAANDEPSGEAEDEVEAHMPRKGSPRKGSPRKG